MKNRIRILMVLVMFFAFFTSMMGTHAVTVDDKGPILRSVGKESGNYSAGDKVYIDIDAYDEVSGISLIYLTYINKTTLSDDYGGLYVYDLDTNPYIKLPENMAPGEYVLQNIWLVDNAGNSNQYYIDDDNYITSFFNDSMIKMKWDMNIIVEDNGKDIDPPVLKKLVFNKNTLGVGEKLIIIAGIDDASGIKEAVAEFDSVSIKLEYHNGIYIGEYIIPEVVNTELRLRTFSIIDNADNSITYQTKKCDIQAAKPIPCTLNDFIKNDVVTITNAVNDTMPPILNGIEINKNVVAAPAFIKITVDATDNLSGVASVIAYISQKDKYSPTKEYWLKYNEETKKYEGIIDVDQYTSSGTYVIHGVTLMDNSNNGIYYYTSDYCDLMKEKDNWNCTDEVYKGSYTKMKEVSFEVTGALMIGEVTSTISSELINKIKNAPDGSNIMIDATNSKIIPATVFETIKDTNKNIYIESNGIQWIFNGKDIINPKQIDVTTIAEIVDSEEISNMLEKAIQISFAENGELPGKALIRVKADYTFRDYIGIEDLFVYYVHDSDNLLDRVATKIAMTEDGYYEFYIIHNSNYVITNKQAEDEHVSDNLANLALNDNSITLPNDTPNKQIKELIIFSSGAAVILTTLLFIFRKKIFNKKFSNN